MHSRFRISVFVNVLFGVAAGAVAFPPTTIADRGDLSARPQSAERGALDRSPVDLALAANGNWFVTANQTANSVSLVDTRQGRVLDEIAVGLRPTAIALCPDGQTLAVSCSTSNELVLVAVSDTRLRITARIPVSGEPTGIAIDSTGTTAYVALPAVDQVAVVDLVQGRVESRIAVGRWPRYLALSPDGTRLVVGTSGDQGVSVIDPQKRKLLFTEKFMGLNIGHMQITADGEQVYFPWIIYRRNPIDARNIRLGWVLASRIARMRLDKPVRREVLSLDPPGEAVADPHGLALTPDEQRLLVAASGTHELLVFRVRDLPVQKYAGTDHIESRLLADPDRFYRIKLGGRPMGVRTAADNRTAYVANYLDNSVQVVDLDERRVTRSIFLGGPETPSLAHRGEAIFYDATRSLDQWYSCFSCHYEGGSNAVAMDTTVDGSSRSFKTVLPLYDLPRTGPWTWHGWQDDLRAAMDKSLTETMLGPKPGAQDVDAILAYFDSIRRPPNPHRHPDGSLVEAAKRGRTVFLSAKAACADCHHGDYLSDGEIHDVGTGSESDRYEGYNTPSLRGVYRKIRLMHDGRCRSLEELLTGPHNPKTVNGLGDLTERELSDLIAYLKSL